MVALRSFLTHLPSLLPRSYSVQSFKDQARTLPRSLYFAQLVVLLLAVFLLSRAHPPPLPPTRGSGAYSWGGFDEVCVGDFPSRVCEEYGPQNVKLSRSYEGTGTRFREVFRRALETKAPLRVAVLGGSVSGGHGIGNLESDKIWVVKTFNAINEAYPHPKNSLRNAAVGAVGSEYFGACWENRIKKEEVDIIFVEHGINDLFAHDSAVTMEDLLRGLLDLPQRPAVLVARTIGLEAEMIAVGGDEHLPVASYYDVPTISLRPVLLPLLFKEPARETEYFVGGDGWLDRRHIGEKGHKALGDLIASYVVSQLVVAQRQLADLRLSGHEDWRQLFGKQREGAHDWPGIEELGDTPKLRLFSKYEPDRVVVPMRTQCLTMDEGDFVSNHLLPKVKDNDGWSERDHSLWAETIGSSFEVELDVTGGKVEIYYIRNGESNWKLGAIHAWMDGDEESKKLFDGYRDGGQMGEFSTVAEGLLPGKHVLHVELSEGSSTPHGGTEFRIISIIAL